MNRKNTVIAFIFVLLAVSSICPAIEQFVFITVTEDGSDLKASVEGIFELSGFNCYTTLFPVPPDANNIDAGGEGISGWYWSEEEYETYVLEQQPFFPMITWSYCCLDYCPITVSVGVEYDHYLIKNGREYILFYANESFEDVPDPWFPHGYFSGNNFHIYFPADYEVKSVKSRDVPIDYEIDGTHLSFYIAYDDPDYDRLLIVFKKVCPYLLKGDLNDDCIVNMTDIAIMAQSWLINCHIEPENPACVPKG